MSAAPGGSGFTLTVNGTEFVSSSVVNWNGTAVATIFVSSSQLTATVPASDIATPGTATVTVSNPTPGGGTSNVEFFDVSNPANSVTFTQLPANPTFPSVGMIIAADFNGDGKLDLAYASGSNVIIQLGTGDGSFQAPATYPGSSPAQIIAGDFNGDGKLDLAVSNGRENTISIFLGNGDGTFQPQTTFATGVYPMNIVAGDFNGDGKLDLATGSFSTSGGVSILLGNGDGTFQSHVDYDTSQGACPITVADFNRDGKLDLVYLNCVQRFGVELSFLQGNGDGTFQAPVRFASPEPNPFVSMITADVNGDDKLDVIVVDIFQNGSGGGIFVYLGNGDGTFQSPVEYGTGLTSVDLGVQDFTADGKLDVALANNVADTYSILLGNGDGTFQGPIDFPTGSFEADSLAVGDYNGDGKMDLAVAVRDNQNGGAGSVIVFLQGQFPAASITPKGLAFGQQNVGTTSAPKIVTLTNSGLTSLSISNIQITGTNAGDFAQGNNCPATLGVNANCQISVTFTPTAPGNRAAAVSINDNAAGNPQAVPLTGTTPVYLSPPTVTFPNQYVGTSGLPQSVQLTNTGNAALTITSVATSPADFAPLSTCGNSLAPGASCSIGVFFDPTTSGTRNGILTVMDTASDSPQTAALTGVGQDFSMVVSSSASATVSPGQSATYTVTVVPAGGFNQTVLLNCSGAPSGSNCSVSPSAAILNGSKPTPVTVTVTTAGASASLAQAAGFPLLGGRLTLWLSLCVLPGLFILDRFGARSRTCRRLIRALALACLLSLAITWSACGGGGNSSSGTQPPAYNLTVTGTFTAGSTVLKHAVPLTLIVQ